MAINSSNSNFVNIQSLSKSQLALDSDLLILQTQNGTQTITFNDFNVVKTDIDDNAYVLGSLSGHASIFDSVNTGVLSAASFYANGNRGISWGANEAVSYTNRMTINNGIILSADYVFGSPEYNALYSLVRSTSTTQNGLFKTVFERTGFATIANGASASNAVDISLPSTIGGFVKPYHFTLMPEVAIIDFNAGYAGAFTINAPCYMLGVACNNFVSAPGDANGTLTIRIVSPTVLTGAQKVYFRMLYFA